MDNELTLNEVPVKKISALIGNGQDTIFIVEHPAAPNVVSDMYRTIGGDTVSCTPARDKGKLIYAFATPPTENEYIAVVIG